MKNVYFILLLFLYACSEDVEKTKVKVSSISESVYASGVLKSENQYQVYAKTSGILNHVYVEEGATIKINQILFSIYNETSSLSRQNAQLLAEFNSVNNNKDKLNDLEMNIYLAKNKMVNDSLNYSRKKTLYNQKVISISEFEQAELVYLNAKTALNSMRIKYSDLKKQLNFSAAQANKNYLISQNLENDFLIKSEINGKIYALLKEKGEMVSPQTPIAIIGDDKNFILELQIDEIDISKIEKGQKLMISLDSYKNKVFEGIVTKINPYLNEKSKTFLVEAKFTKQPNKLYPNLSLEANIVIQEKENTMLIPRNFLIDEKYVIKENGQKTEVKVGLKNYEQVEILSGITKNDVLILPKK